MELSSFTESYLKKFHQFYVSGFRNAHVELSPVILYTRKSSRVIRINEVYRFIDIASISIEPRYQKKGIFTALLKKLLETYPTENFFIESIVNENVRKVAEREGFHIRSHNENIEQGYDMYLIR